MKIYHTAKDEKNNMLSVCSERSYQESTMAGKTFCMTVNVRPFNAICHLNLGPNWLLKYIQERKKRKFSSRYFLDPLSS